MREKTVFLDNQIFIYAFERKIEPALSHVSALIGRKGRKLVLSAETLIEFSQSRNVQDAINLTSAALSHHPIWIHSFLKIQRAELRRFLESRYFKRPVPSWTPFAETFIELFPGAHKSVLPEEFVRVASRPEQRLATVEKHKQHAQVLAELQTSTHAGHLTPIVEFIVLRKNIASRMPTNLFSSPNLSTDEFNRALEFCVKRSTRMYKECPSFNTERHLSDYRSSNIKRKPRDSDSIDLTISIAAFPYVDTFVTSDGYLAGGLAYVKAKCPNIATEIVCLK